jgi:hypothetical protein
LHITVKNPVARWTYFSTIDFDTGVSKVDLWYSDTSRIKSRCVFGQFDSTYHDSTYYSPAYSTEKSGNAVEQDCSVDSALARFWTERIYILRNYTGTEHKAIFRNDTITVKTLHVDAITGASIFSIKQIVSDAVVASGLGLVSYSFVSSPGGQESLCLKRYNGKPFDTTEIFYLK